MSVLTMVCFGKSLEGGINYGFNFITNIDWY
nr:MAG TPA: hypothetical protein [Caudoviricetes sp.]